MSGIKNKTGKRIVCHRCKYSWLTNSNALYKSCPSCGDKTQGSRSTLRTRMTITCCPNGVSVIDEAPKEWTAEQIAGYREFERKKRLIGSEVGR